MTLLPAPLDNDLPNAAPAASLLTVARPLPGDVDWRSGISWVPNGCTPIQGWLDCLNDDRDEDAVKCDPTVPDLVEQRPFTLYLPDGGCDAPSSLNFNDRASNALTAYTAAGVSLELATGLLGQPGNISLEGSASVVDTGDVPVSITEGFGLLLQSRVTAGFAGRHVFHVPQWLIPSAEAAYLIGPNNTTAQGNGLVSPGPGYRGWSPLIPDPDGGGPGVAVQPAPAPTGQGWVYISGAVEYGLGPITTPMTRDNQRLRTNLGFYLAERTAIVRFDPCGIFAVLVSI